MAVPSALTIQGVSKTYPNGSRAIKEVSLTVQPRTVFGLIGPNGAGKSTLLKVAAGLLTPDFGSITCAGESIGGSAQHAARFVGLMPDPLGVYTDISAGDYLEFFARVLEIEPSQRKTRIASAVERLRLGPWLDAEVETLSAGWQRRLALGRILLQDVPVLLLDEPAAGLDISARSELLSIVRILAQEGHTVIISSHILPELEELGDVFGVLDQGSWVDVQPGQTFFSGEDLKRGFSKQRWRIRCDVASKAVSLLSAQKIASQILDETTVEFDASSEQEASQALASVLTAKLIVREFGPCQVELNDFVRTLLTPTEHKL